MYILFCFGCDSQGCLSSVCVWVCVCVFVGVFLCVYVCVRRCQAQRLFWLTQCWPCPVLSSHYGRGFGGAARSNTVLILICATQIGRQTHTHKHTRARTHTHTPTHAQRIKTGIFAHCKSTFKVQNLQKSIQHCNLPNIAAFSVQQKALFIELTVICGVDNGPPAANQNSVVALLMTRCKKVNTGHISLLLYSYYGSTALEEQKNSNKSLH